MKTLRTALLTLSLTFMASPLWAAGTSAVTNGVDQSLAPVPAPAEGSSGGLPQFNPHFWPGQIFWLAIVFAVMYLYFSKVTLPSVGGVLQKRDAKIEGDRAAAERMKNEAESVLNAYEESLKTARTESARLHGEAHDTLKKQAEESLHGFQQKADQQISATESRLNDSKHAVMDEMNTIAAEIASAAAEKIIGVSTDLSHAKGVVESLNKMSKAA